MTNIRFLPLTLLPGVAGFAVSALINTKGSPESVLAVGIVGVGASAGIILYDMHNTALYNAAVHRAKRIEKSLGLPPSTKGKPGGLFNERPDRLEAAQGSGGMRFSPLTMQQDLAVAAIYGVVIGAWMHIIVHASLGVFLGKSQIALATTPVVPILTLVGVTVVFIWRVPQILERSRAEPKMSRVEGVTFDLFTASENLPKSGRVAPFNLSVTRRAMEASKEPGPWCPKPSISSSAKPLALIRPRIRKGGSSPCFDKTILVL